MFTGWALDKTAQATKDLLASGKPIDGVWTSGIDSTVVDAYKTAGKPYVPVVGADNNGFIGQLIDQKEKGLSGATVSNPPAVGGAGLSLALDVLAKKDHPHVVKITPTVWDNRRRAWRSSRRVQSEARPVSSASPRCRPIRTIRRSS